MKYFLIPLLMFSGFLFAVEWNTEGKLFEAPQQEEVQTGDESEAMDEAVSNEPNIWWGLWKGNGVNTDNPEERPADSL